MSHFTTLVVLENYNPENQDFRECLDETLAPFMENCCAEPERKYMEFYDKEEEMRKEYEERTIEQVKLPDGKLVFEWDEQFRKPLKKGELPESPKAPNNLPRVQIHVKEKYKTFEEFAEDYHGHKKDDITGKYGYWENGEKNLIDICIGNEEEILQEVRDSEIAKRILSGEESKRGWRYQDISVLHMQTLREETQSRTSDTRTAAEVAFEREIWDFCSGIRLSPGATKRVMSNLLSSFREENSSGSRPQNRKNKGTLMQSLQYGSRIGGRQYRAACCGSKVSHPAHILGTSTQGGAKWDWFEIGGRWAGYFLLKPGCKGFQGKQYNFEQAYPRSNRADICCKGDIDVEAIRSEAAERAKKKWDRVHEIIKGAPIAKTWEEVKYEHGIDPGGKHDSKKIDAARKAYWAQPRVKAFGEFGRSKEGMELVSFYDGPDDYQMPREKFVQNARDSAIVTFAFVKDGKWFEQGNMGYWGMVSDEKDPETWISVYTKMFDALDDTTLLVVCDCHI